MAKRKPAKAPKGDAKPNILNDKSEETTEFHEPPATGTGAAPGTVAVKGPVKRSPNAPRPVKGVTPLRRSHAVLDKGQGGRFLLLAGQFEDEDGNVYAFDKNKHTVLEFNYDIEKVFPNKFQRVGADNLPVLEMEPGEAGDQGQDRGAQDGKDPKLAAPYTDENGDEDDEENGDEDDED